MFTQQRNADEVAYLLLVQSLSDHEPNHSGWRYADLPELSDADVALICRREASDVMSHMAEATEQLVEAKGCGRNPAVLLPALLELACRRAIFPAVQEECERRDEYDAQTDLRARA